MADIINIKKDGVTQYPVTKPECVIDENGKNVLDLIRENRGESYDDTELRQEIAELSERIEVQFVNENKGLTGAGTIVDSTGEKCTDIVAIKGAKSLMVTSSYSGANVFFYNQAKNLISSSSGAKTNAQVEVPEEAYYVAVTDYMKNTSSLLAYSLTEVQAWMNDSLNVQTQELTQLSEANEVLKEAQQFTDVAIKDLQDMKIDRENDDYYPKMAVGLADNLAGVDVVDSEINFRRSGGGAITDGVARIESIKGNSVVWNQCFAYGRPAVNHTWENNRLTLNGTWDARTQVYDTKGGGASFVAPIHGHKSLLCIKHISGRLTSGSIVFYNLVNGTILATIKPDSLPKEYAVIAVNNDAAYWDYRDIYASTSAENLTIEIIAYDLTQMFGSGNEPTTIEEFYQRIPMGVDLNAYNEGEVIHMDVQSIESQGANAWDEEWELGSLYSATGEIANNSNAKRSKNFFPVLPNTAYYGTYTGASLYIFWYDKDKNFIKNQGMYAGYSYTSPSNAAFAKFYTAGTTYNHDICINISDTAINGKYFPYIKRVEDLAVIRKYFPDGMKSAGTAHDAIRYNKASGKWEKVVKIGEVDMGSLYYERKQYGDIYAFEFLVSGYAGTSLTSVMSPMYTTMGGNASALQNMEMRGSNSATYKACYLRNDAYATGAELKAAMQGVILYYELAEPIVTELDEADQFKDLDYAVWNAGTEKAIAEGKSAPLAADITYGFNAIGKIKELESLVAALRAKVGI